MNLDNITVFAIEGPDKVGKASQSSLLQEALLDLGPAFRGRDKTAVVHRIEIPSRNHTCYKKIYDMLIRRADGSAPAVDYPAVFQTFQVANRFHVQEDLERMTNGKHHTVIVFDRWVASSWAYGMASDVPLKKIEVINEGLIVPDITFVLQGHSFDRPEQEDDAYEDDDSFQAKVRRTYAEWGEGRQHVRTIEANRSRQVVHEEILAIAKQTLSKKGLI